MKIFTNGDRDIIYFVNEFRLVTVDHLESLTGRQTIWRRLPFLLQEKQIYKKERGLNEKYIYSCKPLKRRSLFTLDHDLMITDIHVALAKSETLIHWEQDREAWRQQVHQDAFCTLKHPQRPEPPNTIDFFIEADTGTENHKAITKKLQIYLDYFDVEKNPFRVLFVAPSQARAKNLATMAEATIEPKIRKMFLFTTIHQFRTNCLGPICLMPHGDESMTILPGFV